MVDSGGELTGLEEAAGGFGARFLKRAEGDDMRDDT